MSEKPMKVFIDGEWNGFGGSLLTLALVALDGRELYVGQPCWQPLDPWVKEHVVPVIGDCPCLAPEELAHAIAEFLAPYAAVHLIADWPEDIERFCAALITGPGQRVDTPLLTMEVRRDLDAASAVPHNALHDARAIRDHYLSLMGGRMSDKVIELDMDVVNGALDAVRRHHPHELRGCAAITLDRQGRYTPTFCAMTPEQALAAAESLRAFALESLFDDGDPE